MSHKYQIRHKPAVLSLFTDNEQTRGAQIRRKEQKEEEEKKKKKKKKRTSFYKY